MLNVEDLPAVRDQLANAELASNKNGTSPSAKEGVCTAPPPALNVIDLPCVRAQLAQAAGVENQAPATGRQTEEKPKKRGYPSQALVLKDGQYVVADSMH